MIRAFQIISLSSRFVSSPLQKWKPLWSNEHRWFFTISTKSSFVTSTTTTTSTTTNWNNYVTSFRMSSVRSESNSEDVSVSSSQSLAHLGKVSFCQWCGGTMNHTIPDGDDKMRAVCTQCGKIAYQNPKMVVGCLVEHEDKILLCKRKIEPSYGLWTLPSGFLEIGESALQGAARETREEAGAEVEVMSPFAQLDIPYIGHNYIFFRAKLKSNHFAPGPESLECRLFAPDDIPFDSLAFSSMVVTLNWYIEDLKAGKTKFHYCTIKKRPGSGPSDIRAYTLDNNLQS